MLEVGIEFEDGATVYKPSFNRDWLKRVHEKRERERQARLEEEAQRLVEARIAEELRQERELSIEHLSDKAEDRLASLLSQMRGRIDRRPHLTVIEIIATVAAKHGLSIADIKGRSRKVPIVNARFEAIALTKRLRPELSLPQIGRQFGGRDHTTILHALRKVGLPTGEDQE